MLSWSRCGSLSQARETEPVSYGQLGNNYTLTLTRSLIGVILFGSTGMILKKFIERLYCITLVCEIS